MPARFGGDKMPIYEFYCPSCHRLFSFLSRRVGVSRTPACPKCKGHQMRREVSPFAAPRKSGETRGAEEGGEPGGEEEVPVEEERVERALDTLAAEAASMGENEDPRQAARLMRRFSEMTGMPLGEGMEEAMRRLEAGEDPEAVEEELGDQIEREDPFETPRRQEIRRRRTPPSRDPTLYDLG